MPKSYEDEIRELLKGMDRFPGEGARRPPPRLRRAPAWRLPSIRHLRLDAHRLMGGALILMLFAWIMRGPWSAAFPGLFTLAGYISLASVILFIVALVMLIRAGRFGGTPYRSEQRWRGQVINMPRRGGLLTAWRNWWRRTLARLTRRRSRYDWPPRGRDPIQW
jgi:hypothetical protein